MSRPVPVPVSAGLEAWDAEFQKDLDIIFDAPFPIYNHNNTLADLTTNYPPANYDQCMCMVNDTTAGWVLAVSDGTNWIIVGGQGTDPSDIAGTTGGSSTALTTMTMPADTPATADALRDDLVANAFVDVQENFEALKLKVNGILAAMRAAGQM